MVGFCLSVARSDNTNDDKYTNNAANNRCGHPNYVDPPNSLSTLAEGSRFTVAIQTTVVDAIAVDVAKLAIWSTHFANY